MNVLQNINEKPTYGEKKKYAKHSDYSCVQPKLLSSVFSNVTSSRCFLFANHRELGSNDQLDCEVHRFHFEAPRFVVCEHHLMYLMHLK